MGRHSHGKGKKKRGGKSAKSGGGANKSTRFKVGCRVDCRVDTTPDKWVPATIIELWYDTEQDFGIVPYKMCCDNGCQLYAPYDLDNYIKVSTSPPMAIKFLPGSRIECQLYQSTVWKTGTVISANENWAESNNSPYHIRYDDGEKISFWGPENTIREVDLRFKVGDRVERGSNSGWLPGTIVKLRAKEDFWKEGGLVPYRIRLDNGCITHAPLDVDDCIRLSDVPPLDVKHLKGARVEIKLGETDDWLPGTVIQSNGDWAEHDRPPYFIRLFDDGNNSKAIEYEDFWGPNNCIRASNLSSIADGLDKLDLFDTTDDDLFAPPPPRPDCPICFIPMPIECDEYVNQPCCGKSICHACDQCIRDDEELDKSCPFCRCPYPQNGKEIMALSRKRIELHDDAEIMFCVGCYYKIGDNGLPKDEKKSFEYFLRAADLGSVRACTNVSIAYKNGEVVKEDKAKQRHYLEKAAKLGEVRARYGLGELEERNGNIELAFKHWKMAAISGLNLALDQILQGYKQGALSKDEYIEILHSSQRAKEEEWSKEREKATAGRRAQKEVWRKAWNKE